MNQKVYSQINKCRQAQIKMGYDAIWDDKNSLMDWREKLEDQLEELRPENVPDEPLIAIAALAVAALESIERRRISAEIPSHEAWVCGFCKARNKLNQIRCSECKSHRFPEKVWHCKCGASNFDQPWCKYCSRERPGDSKNPCGEISTGQVTQPLTSEWQHSLMHKLGTPHNCPELGTEAPGKLYPHQQKLVNDLLGYQKAKNQVFSSVYGRKGETWFDTMERVIAYLGETKTADVVPEIGQPFVAVASNAIS